MGNYLPVFFDTLEGTEQLSDEELGRLIRAAGAYAMGKEDYTSRITGNEKYVFPFLKGQIDRNDEISKVRAKSRAIKRDQNGSNDINAEQNGTNGIKTEQTATNSPNNNNNKNKNENKKQVQEQKQQRFDQFWAAYPRHEAKAVAMKAFEKLNPDDNMLAIMLSAIERWKGSSQWKEAGGQFIPHPSTWINQKRWEDEPPVANNGGYSQRDYSGETEAAIERMMGAMIK